RRWRVKDGEWENGWPILDAPSSILHHPLSNCLHAFLHQPADFLELRMIRAADPLEDAALRSGENGAGPLEAAQGEVVIDSESAGDRVYGNIDAEVLGQ